MSRLVYRRRRGIVLLIQGYEQGTRSVFVIVHRSSRLVATAPFGKPLRFVSRRQNGGRLRFGCRRGGFADDEFGGEDVVIDVFFVRETDQDVAGGSA